MPRGEDRKQREFIWAAWLSGMSQQQCIEYIKRDYGREAATAFVPMLWGLRREQMAAFTAAARERSRAARERSR